MVPSKPKNTSLAGYATPIRNGSITVDIVTFTFVDGNDRFTPGIVRMVLILM